jgi:hypothetical protein
MSGPDGNIGRLLGSIVLPYGDHVPYRVRLHPVHGSAPLQEPGEQVNGFAVTFSFDESPCLVLAFGTAPEEQLLIDWSCCESLSKRTHVLGRVMRCFYEV